MSHNLFNSLHDLSLPQSSRVQYYSLPALEKIGLGKISRLPISIRIILESVLRNYDNKKITEAHIKQLANWEPNTFRSLTHSFARLHWRTVVGRFGCYAKRSYKTREKPETY